VRGWSSENGLAAGDIYALARTRDGFLWLATDAGLMRFDGTRFELPDNTQFPVPVGESVSCLLVDRQGALWAGTARGRLLRRSLGGQFQEVGSGGLLVEGDKFVSLAEDGEGALWAATARHGVFCCREGKWQVLASGNDSGSPIGPDQVLADAHGHIWVLSEGELKNWSACSEYDNLISSFTARLRRFILQPSAKCASGRAWLTR
jgi:ligand-binding sensor domain-containing protein